ncbi:MAG: alpha/beta fold hydrolase [Acidimicrobiia bacterium]
MERHTVDLHGHELSYTFEGQGPAILLVHGMAGSAETWSPIVPALASRFTVIAPDLPGHGRSAKTHSDYSLGAFANTLRDLLLVLEADHVTVVGQSLGGGIAMQFGYQFPEMADRVAVVGGGGLGRELSPLLRLLTVPGAEIAFPVLFPGFARSAGDRLWGTLHGFGVQAPFVEEVWRAYASLTDADNRRAFVRTLRAVVDPGGQSVTALDKLHIAEGVPALIVWGSKDSIIPVDHAYRAHETLPASRLEIFEGCNHFPHAEQPERFVEVLTSFIDETDPADHAPQRRRRQLAAAEA